MPSMGKRDGDGRKAARAEAGAPERLESDPGPNEREEIQTLLAQIETALNLLEPRDAAGSSEE